MKTIATLKAALPEGAGWDEDETPNGGSLVVYAPDWKAWKSTGTNSACAEYYNEHEWNQTRPTAIQALLEYMADGIEDASEDTIHAMGWEL